MNITILPMNNSPYSYNNYDAAQGNTAHKVVENEKVDPSNCSTCRSRTYVCSTGGTMQISSEASFAVVAAHENEHVSQAKTEAKSEGREVITASTRLFTDTCAECGTSYVSGGEATTVTGKKSDEQMGALHQSGQLLDLYA